MSLTIGSKTVFDVLTGREREKENDQRTTRKVSSEVPCLEKSRRDLLMRDGSVPTLLLGCPVLPPLDTEFLNSLIQPRNGVGLSFHRVEELDRGTGWELASRQATRRGGCPSTSQRGCRWAEQLVNWTQGIFGDWPAGGEVKTGVCSAPSWVFSSIWSSCDQKETGKYRDIKFRSICRRKAGVQVRCSLGVISHTAEWNSFSIYWCYY